MLAHSADFSLQGGERAAVTGALEFGTVGALLPQGSEAIAAGAAGFIDLKGVTGSDSAGLALLLEWLSVARAAKRSLRYENMPAQLQQLARLSEVEELLLWD
jgi:phospholipid transport system transporter-binding protein